MLHEKCLMDNLLKTKSAEKPHTFATAQTYIAYIKKYPRKKLYLTNEVKRPNQ